MITPDLLNIFENAAISPHGVGFSARLDLSEIVQNGLKRKKWTQKELAAASKTSEAMLTEIIHCERNFTVNTLGRLLAALGRTAKIMDMPREAFTDNAVTFIQNQGNFQMVMTYDKDKKETLEVSGATNTVINSIGTNI